MIAGVSGTPFTCFGAMLLRRAVSPQVLLRGAGGESVFGANLLQCRCHFPFAGERNALALAVLSAISAAWDAVIRARHNGLAGGRVPIENTRGAEVEALQIEETILAFDDGKPGKACSLTGRH